VGFIIAALGTSCSKDQPSFW